MIKNLKSKVTIRIFFVLSLAIVLITLGFVSSTLYDITVYGSTNPPIKNYLEYISAWGSYVGGVIGPLIAIATVFFLVVTFMAQKEELEETKKISERQHETLIKQQFESTFFNMLEKIETLIQGMIDEKGIYDPHTIGYVEGRSFLHAFVVSLKHNCSSLNPQAEDAIIKQSITAAYDKMFYKTSFNLGHYYRYIHNIIKYILREYGNDKLEIEDVIKREEAAKYFGILQAQLSNDEMALIFYNCLSKNSLNQEHKPKFKEWVDKYGLLENIDDSLIIHKSLLKDFPNTKFRFANKIN